MANHNNESGQYGIQEIWPARRRGLPGLLRTINRASVRGLGFGLAGYFESIELAMFVLGAGLIGYWFCRRKLLAAKSCACAPDSGCNTGNACDTP